MFKKTFHKLNSGLGLSTKQNESNNILNTITQLKQEGKTLFGAIYSSHDRHTVYKVVEKSDYAKSLKRRSTFDYINNFTSVIIPKIEQFVERRLLEKFKMSLSKEEQQLVEDSYRMRRHIADTQLKPSGTEELRDNDNQEQIIISGIQDIVISPNGVGFRTCDYSTIGKYIVFPDNLRKEFFPFGCYGDYMNNEFKHTTTLSIMCREESVKLTRAFGNISTHEERLSKIDFEAILTRQYNFKEQLKNLDEFSLYFQEFSYSFLKVLETTNNHEYKYLLTNPNIFDSLVTVLVRSLSNSNNDLFLITPSTRYFIIEEILKSIHAKFGNSFKHTSEEIKEKELKITEKEFYPLDDFNEIVQNFKLFRFNFDLKYVFEFAKNLGIKLDDVEFFKGKTNESNQDVIINLTSFKERSRHQWRPEEMRTLLPEFKGFNTGVLLTGEGNGKSMILAYLHAWAKESGWFVVPVGDLKKYTRQEFPIERHLSGIYFQPELASHFLTDIKVVNHELLRNTLVDLKEYGKFNIVGTKDDDPEPNPILWDDRTKTYTDSWKEWNAIPEEEIVASDHPDHHLRLKEVLPKPKNLLEIVNAGIENNRVATCAVAELMYALSRSEQHKTMFLVDSYNELFKPTIYDSYKYANFKNYSGKIPPHDIALLRMFMKFDGHFYKQGVKVCAISLKEYNMHKFKPELINFPKGYSFKVDNLKLNDLRNAVTYLTYFRRCLYHNPLDIQELWAMSQGNWKHLFHDLDTYFRDSPTQKWWMIRNAHKKTIAESQKF